MKNITGTREWAETNVNLQSGCEHDCRYCFAKSMAVRFKRMDAPGWKSPHAKAKMLAKGYRKRHGVIMFPSSHDITPLNLEACQTVLLKLLKAGNRVLIVSKPHLACTESLCENLKGYRDQILFRFTIGSINDEVLRYWESGAPRFEERVASLRLAHAKGFKTSMSCEPMLDADIDAVVTTLRPHVTDSIWLGRANRLVQIVRMNCPGDGTAVDRARELNEVWNDEAVRGLYARYKEDPMIRWKDSIKQVAGLPEAERAGMDV